MNKQAVALFISFLALIFLAICVGSPRGYGADDLGSFLAKTPVTEIFPKADSYGELRDNPPAVPVLKGGKSIGYVILNTDFVKTIGYSGKPIYILIGLRNDRRIAGAKLVKHSEPIVLTGIPEKKVDDFVAGYAGMDVPQVTHGRTAKPPPVALVAGATVTVIIMDDSIRRATTRAALALGLGGLGGAKAQTSTPGSRRLIDPSKNETLSWDDLVGNGSVRGRRVTIGDINRAFIKRGNKKAIARPEEGNSDATFINLYVASLAAPSIARSLLGDREYKNYLKRLKKGQSGFLIMANGSYSFRGSGYVRGGIFERIQIIQRSENLRFRDHNYKHLGDVSAEGAPNFDEVALFFTPEDAVFDPSMPWRLQLLVQRAIGAREKAFVALWFPYRIPDTYMLAETSPASRIIQNYKQTARQKPPKSDKNTLWISIWIKKIPQIAILVTALIILMIIFFTQHQLSRHQKFANWVRIGFLTFTLLWIGFYTSAQLSVVNSFVFFNILLRDFQWEYFLIEPLIFILWSATAATQILWGRGVFCGWLCPFGALQELINKLAKFLKIPQITMPWWLHERLWALKYMIFMALLGVSLYSITLAEVLAEVEPFKTTILLRFMRAWPYLLFAGGILFIGIFIERFYCRYLCPLGAALAIPARLSIFRWLKRYPNCGDPCHVCEHHCMVQAIEPEGTINLNECMQCFRCQQLYQDRKVCPVMIQKFARPAPGKNTLYRKPRRLGKSREIKG